MYQGYNPAAEAWYGARLILKSLWNGNSVFLPKIRTMIDSICYSLCSLILLTTFTTWLICPLLWPSILSSQLHHLSWQLRRTGHPETASLYPGKNLNTLMGSYWTTRSNIMKRWGDNVIELDCVRKKLPTRKLFSYKRNDIATKRQCFV